MLTARRPQRTIAREATVQGIGFLTGTDVGLRFRPAEPGTGIVFVRTDLPGQPGVPAHIRHVVQRQRRTTIQRGETAVEMVEHVMAALAGLRIDNCTVEIDAGETPGCDGSSRAFTDALAGAGIVEQDRPREMLAIDRPLTVQEGSATITAHPGDNEGLVLTYNLDYGPQTPIGKQSLFLEVNPDSFQRELAPSRTFLLEAEAQAFLQAGMGQRLSASDLLVFGPSGPIGNTLRYPDECVRHKMLDLVGDLALLPCDLAGHVVAHRSGHALNAALVQKLLQALDQGGKTPKACPDAPVLDIRAIMKIMPHRYPFLLVDRVVQLCQDESILALKNVTYNEPFFPGHWPGRPLMPGVLILEALAQAAGILIAHSVDSTRHDVLIRSIENVKYRRPVVPGDQLWLSIDGMRMKRNTVEVQAVARVNDQVAAEARMRFIVVDAQREQAA